MIAVGELALDNNFFVHPKALVDPNAVIGPKTRIWAFAHVLPNAVIGDDCNVCDHTFIESGVIIGNRVTVKCGVYLWEGIIIEDDVFIGPSATFTNDKLPRSKSFGPDGLKGTLLKSGCTIGANATLLPGLQIGEHAFVAAGSLISRDVPPHALVIGNPGRIKGWVCRCAKKLDFIDGRATCCEWEYFLHHHRVEVKRVGQ